MLRCVPHLAVVLLLPWSAAASAEPLRVKVSPATAPCVEAAVAAYRSATGRATLVETGPVEGSNAGQSFDVVVGADEELTRVIEGGSAHPDYDIDVAKVPWVLLGASAGSSTVKALSVADAKVKVVEGPVGLEARSWLRRSGRATVSASVPRGGPVRLEVGELALVPASLDAGSLGMVVDVPPMVVRAVGMRASLHLTLVGEFLAFLEKGPGNAAFCTCGRREPR